MHKTIKVQEPILAIVNYKILSILPPPFPSLNMPTYQVRIKRSTIQRQREIHMRRCIWKHLAEVSGADIFKFDWILHFSLISISSICHRGLLNQAINASQTSPSSSFPLPIVWFERSLSIL